MGKQPDKGSVMDEKRLAAIEELFERTAVGDEWVFLFCDNMPLKPQDVRDLIAAVRERGEPVAIIDDNGEAWFYGVEGGKKSSIPSGAKLYTAPPTVADAMLKARAK